MEAENSSGEINEEHTYEHIHYVLHIAFIEIRMSDDLQKAQIIADIFHNVPMMMRMLRSVGKIKEEILEKASRHGVEKRIHGWFRSAERNLREAQGKITDTMSDKQVLIND